VTHLGPRCASPSSKTGSVGGGSKRRRGLAAGSASKGSGSYVSTSIVIGSGASCICAEAGSGSAIGWKPSSSTALSSRSNRLGHFPHVRQELATGSLMVPHCEQRHGCSGIR
jgi:hypothetical protein